MKSFYVDFSAYKRFIYIYIYKSNTYTLTGDLNKEWATLYLRKFTLITCIQHLIWLASLFLLMTVQTIRILKTEETQQFFCSFLLSVQVLEWGKCKDNFVVADRLLEKVSIFIGKVWNNQAWRMSGVFWWARPFSGTCLYYINENC